MWGLKTVGHAARHRLGFCFIFAQERLPGTHNDPGEQGLNKVDSQSMIEPRPHLATTVRNGDAGLWRVIPQVWILHKLFPGPVSKQLLPLPTPRYGVRVAEEAQTSLQRQPDNPICR